MSKHYLHHRIQARSLAWQAVSDGLNSQAGAFEAAGGRLYGIWRNQIGRERDEINAITCWDDVALGRSTITALLAARDDVVSCDTWAMHPTLRPETDDAPRRQGNYAFRFFRTPPENWEEFLQLCADAWPGFEASYEDCQIIGLWRYDAGMGDGDLIHSLLLTRRPDLASWERTKLPQGEVETEVRRKLSRRYDLCESTYVHTTTLLTASDAQDQARWT
jgi:hypothetical protein